MGSTPIRPVKKLLLDKLRILVYNRAMQITNEQRWLAIKQFFDEFRGDIWSYPDGSIGFSPTDGLQKSTGAKDIESFADKLVRKAMKK
jgi:hypothetical protein